MIRGLYTSATGMMAQMQQLDVVANNMANVNTTGFRGARAVQSSFPDTLMASMQARSPSTSLHNARTVGGASMGTFVQDIAINFSSGALQQTGGALDLAITGDGFFTINVPAANEETIQMYTRNGAFTISHDGYLITLNGYHVAGQGFSSIAIPHGDIYINTSGAIYVDNQYIDTLQMASFEDLTMLSQHGYNLFALEPGVEAEEFEGHVTQGFLEASNVNSIREMISLINISRAYEINQRMVTIHDNILSQAVNEIARR